MKRTSISGQHLEMKEWIVVTEKGPSLLIEWYRFFSVLEQDE
jgi:hypothetical protein